MKTLLSAWMFNFGFFLACPLLAENFSDTMTLRRAANDISITPEERVVAAHDYLVKQPGDGPMMGTILRLAGDLRDEKSQNLVRDAMQKQGDDGVNYVVRSYENNEIPHTMAMNFLQSIGTPRAYQEKNRIYKDNQGHVTQQPSTRITHERIAPEVTEPGWKKHVVDR